MRPAERAVFRIVTHQSAPESTSEERGRLPSPLRFPSRSRAAGWAAQACFFCTLTTSVHDDLEAARVACSAGHHQAKARLGWDGHLGHVIFVGADLASSSSYRHW